MHTNACVALLLLGAGAAGALGLQPAHRPAAGTDAATAHFAAPAPATTPSPHGAAHDFLAAELLPLDDEITYLRALLAEIERQGQNRVAQLGRWIGWWTKIKALATETATKLSKNFEERVANAEKAGALIGQLLNSRPPEQRHVPHFGWHDTATIANLANTLRQELAKALDLAAKLKAEWHIAAVGWITGEGIQRAIDDMEKQIRDINQGMRDGTYEVHIAGPGWVRGAHFRQRMEDLDKQKQAIRDKVSAGDYEVHVPGLGPRTRKRLDAEIAAAEAELARRRETLAKGELTIHRPPTGWQNLTQLRATLEADALSYDVMKKTVADGVYTVWLVETGWAKRVDLEAKVKEHAEGLAKTQAALAAGDYQAQLPVGWTTAKQIEKALEDLGKQIGQPNLDAKAREYLAKQIELHRKSLAELQAISAYDLAIRGLEKAKASRLVTEPMKLARPDFERREVVRAEKDETLAEYPIEGALWLKPLELQLERLRVARSWIP